MSDNKNDEKKPDSLLDLGHKELVEKSVEELYDEFKKTNDLDSMKIVTSYCLAKALSNSEEVSETVRLEYLKETGRNLRVKLKGDDTENTDDPKAPFKR